MAPPTKYDLKNKEGEFQRLLKELEGYMRISVKDGTDREGRKFALEALQELNDPKNMYHPVLTWTNYNLKTTVA